jgi:diketogulonate reductase-like aldo/keto reductase
MKLNIESTLTLNNGVEIPRFGLGVFQNPPGSSTVNAVTWALEAGYRHIDTARIYGNEATVGEAIRRSGIPRASIFVTTKLWNSDQGYQSTLAACEQSLKRLELDFIDLYLIHWPVQHRRLDSWRAMEELLESSKCRSIGVSNYMVRHLEELLASCRTPPAVNQIELHPYNYRTRLPTVERCREQGVRIEAYCPLTQGRRLGDPRLVEIAQKYDKTAAQVLIRWSLQQDLVVIPKSTKQHRIRENCQVFDFEISGDDMSRLDDLNENLVCSWDPTDAP